MAVRSGAAPMELQPSSSYWAVARHPSTTEGYFRNSFRRRLVVSTIPTRIITR